MRQSILRHVVQQLGSAAAVAALAVAPIPASQAQTVGGAAGPVSPTRVADCDITVQSCGGLPTFEGGGTGGGGGGGSVGNDGLPVCGYGARTICNVTTTRTCESWRITAVNLDVVVKSLQGVTVTAGATISCESWATTTYTFRYV